MDAKVVEFTALLRRNGVRVSLSETMDAFQALCAVGLGDRDTVRAALRATAVKRAVDVPTFDRLFDLYFSGLGEIIREATAATQAAIGLDEEDFARFLEQLEKLLQGRGTALSPLAQALLRADAGRLEQLLRDAAREARLDEIEHGFQEGRFTHAMAAALGLGDLGAELDRLRRDLAGAAPDGARAADEGPRAPPARPPGPDEGHGPPGARSPGRAAAGPPGPAESRREELLLPHRGGDPPHGRGGDEARPAAEERGRRPAPAGEARPLRLERDPA